MDNKNFSNGIGNKKSNLSYAFVVGAEYSFPILVPLLFVKIFELGLSTRAATFASNIPVIFFTNVGEYIHYSGLAHITMLGAILAFIIHKSFGVRTFLLSFVISIVAVVILKILQLVIFHRTFDVSSSYMLNSAWVELQSLRAVWSKDGLFALLLMSLIATGFLLIRISLMRSLLYTLLLVICGFWLVFEATYFITTRSVTSAKAFRYFFEAPSSAFMASKDALNYTSMSLAAVVVLIMSICVCGVHLIRRHRQQDKGDVSIYMPLWAVLLLLLLPVRSPDPSLARFSNNYFFRLLQEFGFLRNSHGLSSEEVSMARASIPGLDWRGSRAIGNQGSKRYNVMIVFLESTRANATGLYQSGLSSTPNMEELAKDSLIVDSMWAVIPRTSAAWVASLAGVYPGNAAVSRAWSTYPDELRKFPTALPNVLGKFHYESAFITATNLELENEYLIVKALGFDKVETDKYLDHRKFERINAYGIEDLAVVEPTFKFVDDVLGRNDNFFVTIMTNVGHYPYNVPSDQKIKLFPGKSEFEQKYLNGVVYQDRFLGELIEGLRRRMLLDSTILVVMGDHGDGTTAEGSTQRAFVLNDDVLHVPALLRFPPKLRISGRRRGLRQEIDLSPTILEALDISITNGKMPGLSFLHEDEGHDRLFFSSHMESTFLGMRKPQVEYFLDPNENVITVNEYPSPSTLNSTCKVRVVPLDASADKELLRVRAELLYWSGMVEANILSRSMYQ